MTAMPYQPACRVCGKPEHGSLACAAAPGWSVVPETEAVITRLDPYFVHERIAEALERIASALESNQETKP